MIKTDNKILRNLQEQVLYNSNVLEDFLKGDKTIAEFGLRVIGIYEELPDLSAFHDLSSGDTILVGTQPPYTYYVYTNDRGEYQWVNIGIFPEVGPQGPQGIQGPQGEKGDASKWYYGTLPSPSGYTEGDMWLDSAYNVYRLTNGVWINTVNIKGAAGPQGPRGYTGETGATGERGPKGEKGQAGAPYSIKGTVASVSALEAITPVENTGYLVGTAVPYDIYVSVPNSVGTLQWKFVGTSAINNTTSMLINFSKDGYFNLNRVKTINGETISDSNITTSLSFNPEIQFEVLEGDDLESDVHLASAEFRAKVSKNNVGDDDHTNHGELILTRDDLSFNKETDGNIVKWSASEQVTTNDSVGTAIDNLENSVSQLRTDLEDEVDTLSNKLNTVERRTHLLPGKYIIDSYTIDEENQTINITLSPEL